MDGTWHCFLPSFRPSFHRFLLTFSTFAIQYIKRCQSLATKSEKIYSPNDLFCAMFLIRGSFLHGRQRMFFSLKFSPAVKPIRCVSLEVAPCMIDLNITPGHKSHLSLYTIIRESLHHFSFEILSDTCDNLVLEE